MYVLSLSHFYNIYTQIYVFCMHLVLVLHPSTYIIRVCLFALA